MDEDKYRRKFLDKHFRDNLAILLRESIYRQLWNDINDNLRTPLDKRLYFGVNITVMNVINKTEYPEY